MADALSAVLLVAAMEALLVQWTSYAVSPATLAVDFATTAVVLALVVVPVTAALRLALRRPWPLASAAPIVTALTVYDLSRIRTEKMSLLDPASCVALGILALGGGFLQWRTSTSAPRRATEFVGSLLLVGATAAAWVVLHIGGRLTPVLGVVVLLGAATATAAAVAQWSLARHPTGIGRSLLASSSPLLALAIFSVASYPIVPGLHAPEVRSHESRAPLADAKAPPNVIVLVMDTVRADHLSVYGYRYPTSPELEKFAARAYSFRRAIANSNWSLPSHATLLTGLLPHQHGAHTVVASVESRVGAEPGIVKVAQQPLAEAHETIVRRLRPLGYEAGVIAANYAWLSADSGLLRDFDYVDSRPATLVGWEPFCGAYLRHQPIAALTALYERSVGTKMPASAVVDHVLDFLARPRRGPFFLLANFMDAHAPYGSALYAERICEIRERFRDARWGAANLEAYDRSIAFLDRELGRLFAELAARELFDNALIVVTSDHGERFGASGRGWHGDDLSQSSIHIPLLIKMPRQTKGERVERRAQLADVAPTILAAGGLPIPADFFGSPLAEHPRAVIAESYLASGGSAGPIGDVAVDDLDAKVPTRWALFDGPWKLVRGGRGPDALYDLAGDPAESENLALRRSDVAKELGERLAELLPRSAFSDYRVPIAQASASSLMVEKLNSLGYAQ